MEPPVVRGDTRIVALFGDPVIHSISPLIHNHAFRSLGLPYVYVPLRVDRVHIHTAVQALRALSFAGANVTLPHKQAFVSYCDRISPLSQRLGVVNTLYFDGPMLCGTTTDPEGFLRAMRWMDHDPANGHVVVLGNGGTARTISLTLADLPSPPQSLTIVGRDSAKSRALASAVREVTGFPAESNTFGLFLEPILERCTLLINATPLGMAPHLDASPLPPESFRAQMTVFDTIYNPAQTRFLAYAMDAGCRFQNGLRMLLFQALASFELWTGHVVSEDLFDMAELTSIVSGTKG